MKKENGIKNIILGIGMILIILSLIVLSEMYYEQYQTIREINKICMRSIALNNTSSYEVRK